MQLGPALPFVFPETAEIKIDLVSKQKKFFKEACMMQIVKKLCVWTVAVCMLLAAMPPVWAEDVENGNDNISGVLDQAGNITRTLLDFNNPATVTGGTSEQGDTPFTVSAGDDGVYEAPNTASAKWTQSGEKGVYRYDLYPAGQSALDSAWFHLRLYSPEASGAVYQFIPYNGTDSVLASNAVAVTNITADWVGWKTVSVPLTYDVGKSLHGVAFAYGAWDAGYATAVTDGASLYLSKVWMSVTLPDKTVWSFDSEESLKASRLFSTTDFAKSAWYKEEPNTMSAKWQQKANGELIEYQFDSAQNWACGTNANNSYQYVNFRVYSPEASGATFQFMKISNGPIFNSGYLACYAGITADWQGWKTVSLPISSFAGTNRSWESVSGMAFTVGWGSDPGFIEGTGIYMDRIWLSVNAQPEDFKEASPLPDKELLKFDNEETITDTHNLAGTGFQVSRGDAFGFCEEPNTMSARWTQEAAGVHSEKALTEQADDWSEYGFLNIRAYSPEARGAIFQVGLFEGGSHYKWSGGTGNNSFVNFTADWTGWKTVSIPLTNLPGTLTLKSVNGISFTNGSWAAAGEANPPHMAGATVYMDRIWLSEKEAGANPVSVTEQSVSLMEEVFIKQPEKSTDGNSLAVQARLRVNGDTALDRKKVGYWVAQYDGADGRLKKVKLFPIELTEGIENGAALDISDFVAENGDTIKLFIITPDSLEPVALPGTI